MSYHSDLNTNVMGLVCCSSLMINEITKHVYAYDFP